MYRMIGGDGQQYGPVSAEQIRSWLKENRVRPETLLQAEGTTEWKMLSSFPEFAPVSSSTPPQYAGSPPVAPPVHLPADARASNKIAAGICGILLGSLGVHKFILGYTGAGVTMLLITLLSIPAGFLTCGVTTVVAPTVMHIIGLIEGIIYLTKSDEEFVRTYVDGRREWF